MGIIATFGGFMAMQFEKHADGYLYRVNGKGPAWPATEQEYHRFLRQAGINFLLSVAAMGLSIVAAAMLVTLWFPQGDEPGGMVLMGGFLLLIGFAVYRAQYRSMRAPERALAGRTPIDPPPPVDPPHNPAVVPPGPRGGTLAFIGYCIAEVVGGIAALIAVAGLLSRFGDTVSVVGGLIAAIATVFAIDRICERRTGSSAIDWLPFIP